MHSKSANAIRDLDVLGRGDFMQRNSDLRRELSFLGKHFTDEE